MNGGPSILHFSTADMAGGSARSARRIHQGLKARGVQSRMLVGFRQGDDPDVRTVAPYRLVALADRVADKIGKFSGQQYRFVPSNFFTARHPWLREADIVQLYNIHGGYFALDMLKKLRDIPLVWRLSDLWPMTGHCAYPGDCERWLQGCGSCPDLETYPPIAVDTSAALFQRKSRIYKDLNLTIVAPSSWTESQARRSPLLGQFPVVRIPNGLDGTVFRQHDRGSAREFLGLPQDAEIILFCAHILDNNPRKGGDVLMRALKQLGAGDGANRVLALMGEGGESWEQAGLALPIYRLGFQSDPDAMARAYAAANVVVIPSVLENLPNTLVETLASGRAVIASDCGGMADGVRDGETGFLVPTGDEHALAERLEMLLSNADLRVAMEAKARELFNEEFSAVREIERVQDLHRRLLVDSAKTVTNQYSGC